MSNRKHYSAAIAAFAVWGFFSIPLRALKAYTAGEILYFRIACSTCVLAIVIALFKRSDLRKDYRYLLSLPKPARKQVVALTLAGAVLLTVNWLTFIYIVNTINIKTASFSYLICPVITAILGYRLIKENLNRLQWIAVALCAISCLVMGFHSALELGFSVLTALTYALYLISQRKNQGFDRIIILGIQVLFALLILTVFYAQLVTKLPLEATFYEIIFVIAVLFTVIPLFLNLYALNKINSATIGILMYLNPVLNFTLAITLFKEEVFTVQLVGYSVIVVALVLFNYPNFKKFQVAIGASK